MTDVMYTERRGKFEPLHDTQMPDSLSPNLHRPGWPVIEVFGPTVQGEGPDAGRPCYFVRFGGCDYRCSWCDSMHAVDPAQVRANARRMVSGEIVDELTRLGWRDTQMVVLSGGNPALHDLTPLIDRLHAVGAYVAVETQGSVWQSWLGWVDSLVVSPKPPSSGMATEKHMDQLTRFIAKWERDSSTWQSHALKVPVFSSEDYEWAMRVHCEVEQLWPMYLSVGTDYAYGAAGAINTNQQRIATGERYRWLCEKAAHDPAADDVVILPQLHTLAWGNAKGV